MPAHRERSYSVLKAQRDKGTQRTDWKVSTVVWLSRRKTVVFNEPLVPGFTG